VKTLLVHGDTLCTDDVDYQNWRRIARSADWQRAFLEKSRAERRSTILGLREKSKAVVQRLYEELYNKGNLAAADEIFAPDTEKAILSRVLSNLRRSWERREKYAEALEALRWAEILDPEEVSYRRERGLLLLKSGRTEEALAALDSYVSAAEGEDAEAVQKLIGVVRERGLSSGDAELLVLEPPQKRIFTLEEARSLLPKVKEVTSDAVFKFARLSEGDETETERQGVVGEWAREILALGAEIKGLWLVDFDSGAGYYCWKYPEAALDYFHGYEEGFAGRLPLQ